MNKCVIGIDIGGTNIRIGAVDPHGEMRCFEKVPSRVLIDDGEMVDALAAFIRDYLKRHGLEGSMLAIAIGFPSPVSKDKRIVYNCANLQNETGGFDGRDVVTPLERAFGVPVMIEKDSVFLLQYDIAHNDLRGKGTVVGIYYGTGIGNMVYVNGQFLSGKHGVACDLGHIPVYHSDRYCTCGNRGCIECYAAGHVLRDIWEERFSDSPIDELFALHSDDESIRDFVECMSLPLASEINIFDPDYVIIGGGLPSMKGFPMDLLLRDAYEFTRKPYPGDDITFLRAANADDVGVRGGALYAYDRLEGGDRH